MSATITLEDGQVRQVRADGMVEIPCRRCGGSGHFSFNLLDGTMCYGCYGRGREGYETVEDAQRKAHQRVLARARADRKRAAKEAAAVTALAEWRAALGARVAVVDRLIAEHTPEQYASGFLSEMAVRAAYRPLTDGQLAAVERALAQRDAEAAAPVVPAPEGRVEVIGEVISVKDVEDTFSPYGGTVWKMTVKADGGYRVHCTIPSSLGPEMITASYDEDMYALRGSRIRFTATLTRSADDESFAFGKRPSKATRLSAAEVDD